MRGKVRQNSPLCPWAGITPACAGKRGISAASICPIWDHPRVCGEKSSALGVSRSGGGSPPRVRGKAMQAQEQREGVRITPACAGKRRTLHLVPCMDRDHPRVCGEKRHIAVAAKITTGSPPRVRGKVCARPFVLLLLRITPACAGKSPPRTACHGTSWDHPRVCGEKSFTRLSYCSAGGSPPRVRGKVPVCCPEHRKVRITPAYAGKRACTTTAIIQPKDHPRVCGEKGRAGGAGSWSWSELRWLLTRFPVKVIDTV